MIAISILFYTHWKGSEKNILFRSSQRLFNSLTGYPANETGYRISKKAGYPDIRYNPNYRAYIILILLIFYVRLNKVDFLLNLIFLTFFFFLIFYDLDRFFYIRIRETEMKRLRIRNTPVWSKRIVCRDVVRSAHYLRSNENLTDVVFHCEDGSVQAHKVCRVVCPYFEHPALTSSF